MAVPASGYAAVMAASQKKKPVTPVSTPTIGAIPNANPNIAKGMASAYAGMSTPVSTPVSTPSTSQITPREITYGQNIPGATMEAGSVQQQIAEYGKQWNAATTKEARDAIHGQAMQLGTANGGTYDPRTGKWAFQAPSVDAYGANDAKAEVDKNIAAYMAEDAARKSATMFGVNQNNAFLDAEIKKLNEHHQVDKQDAQLLQNRRGGWYSGGLDYQLGNIGKGYAEAQGGLTRDVAARNQQLLEQYGIQANTIAENIRKLQESAPDIIRSKILEHKSKTADLESKNIGNEIDRLKLKNLPEEMSLGLDKLKNDVAIGNLNLDEAKLKLKELQDPNSITNRANKLELDAKKLGNEELRKRINEIGKKPALTPEEKQLKEIALKKAQIELNNLEKGKPDKAQTADSMRTYFDSMVQRDHDTKAITNAKELENAIVNSPLSDYDAYQMYLRFGLPWNGPVPSPNQ